MTTKMTQWGTGPVFALASIVYGVAVGLTTHDMAGVRITVVPYSVLLTLGIVLIAIGVPIYILSAKAVIPAFNSGQLVTDGVYGMCRHPLYGAWIVFIAPGIELLTGSWIGLTTPIVMYLLLRLLVGKEEEYLTHHFGNRYEAYRRRVPFLLPLGWLRRAT